MAATNQLPKIAALVDRLSPVGRKQRGMTIEADDWNVVVDVLQGILEIDRAQEDTMQSSLQSQFAPINHAHLGQVEVPWLDAGLQATLSDGGGGGVPTRLALTDMTQKLQSLSDQVARLATATEDQRRQLDGFVVNDADRAKALRDFDARFAAVENLKTSVTGLSTQIDGLKSSLTTVLDLRNSLKDANGAPIDVGKMRQDVADLQGLRENLKGVDGTLLHVRDLEVKLREVADVSGVGAAGGLDTRLAQAASQVQTKLEGEISTQAAATETKLRAETTAAVASARADSSAALAKTQTDLTASTATLIAASESRANAAAADKVSAAIQSFRLENTTTVNGLLDQRLSTLPGQIQTAVAAGTTQLAASLRTEFTATIATQVQTQTAAINTKVDSRFTDFQGQIAAIQTGVPVTVKGAVASAMDTFTGTVNTRVDAQVAQARTATEAGLDTRVKTAIDASNATLDTRIGASLDQRLATLDTRIGLAVTHDLANLPAQVGTEVKTQIAAANFAGQIVDSATKTTTQLRAEIAQSAADLQAKSTTAINDSLKLLRGEIAVAQKSATDAAVQNATVLVAGLRTETGKLIDAKIAASRTGTTSTTGSTTGTTTTTVTNPVITLGNIVSHP